MTGVPSDAAPRKASFYFWLVVAGAIAAAAIALFHLSDDTRGYPSFAVLGVGVAVAQLFAVRSPANQAYHTTAVFLLAAALVLPPELVALMAFVQHAPDWFRRTRPARIEVFNTANFTLAVLAAWGAADLVRHMKVTELGAYLAAQGAAACLAFVAVNHILLAPMLRFARGHSLRESGLFTIANLTTDTVLATLGVALGLLWRQSPWLSPFAVAPLVLIYRSLAVPTLIAEARVDVKTGLFNARHFTTALREELARAARFGRPLALVMADLDLLREVNNTYGHLTGDAVLAGVAQVFQEHLREYDVPARFGGEEFAILLPETSVEEALEIAERIRRAVATAEFKVPTSPDPVRATVSMGVAAFPRDGADANVLVHRADLAVYKAKLQGRNRVVDCSDATTHAEPPAARLYALTDEGVA